MTRLFDRLRAAGITPQPGTTPPIGGDRPRPGSDMLEHGVCSAGHPIDSIYDTQIRHDRVRCIQCVTEAEIERATVLLRGAS